MYIAYKSWKSLETETIRHEPLMTNNSREMAANTNQTACEVLKNTLKQYDYIRFTMSDMNGVPRGKTIVGRHADKFVSEGLGAYSGAIAFGPNNEIPIKTLDKKVAQSGHSSMVMRPDPTTVHELPWVSHGGAKVAEVLCNSYWLDGTPQKEGPRYCAQQAVQKLEDLGLEIKAAFEMEFKVYIAKDRKHLFENLDFCVPTTMADHEEFLYELERNLYATGVNIETIQTEYSYGQFELTLKPSYGIKSVDDYFVFKNTVKELCKRRGYLVSFLAKPDMMGCGSGAHFNFSIWDKKTGKNIMYDEKKEDGLSDFMKHFLAGMLKHIDALTALSCPTVNCYRRIHNPWAPDRANWGIQDRMASYRLKNEGSSGTYFENRLPSGAANPYLVLAGTIAAGLDGVKNKLPCPPASQSDAPQIPMTLADALKALENDAAMVAGVGPECVEWFVSVKREVDLVNLKDCDVSVVKDEHIEAERNQYERLC